MLMPKTVKCRTVYHMIGLKLIALTLNKVGQWWVATSDERKKMAWSLYA